MQKTNEIPVVEQLSLNDLDQEPQNMVLSPDGTIIQKTDYLDNPEAFQDQME